MKEGAVVIVTANNNEVGVFNGTVAKFVRYNKSSDEVVLALNDGRIVNLPKVSRDKEVKRTKSGAHALPKRRCWMKWSSKMLSQQYLTSLLNWDMRSLFTNHRDRLLMLLKLICPSASFLFRICCFVPCAQR